MSGAIAINGSPNREGLTARLLGQLRIPIYHLSENDGIVRAHDAILENDVVVFGTPTHWFNVSALMKALIDRLPEAPDFPCDDKTAFFLAVCNEDGGQQAINQMMAPLNHMGFWIPPYACYIYNSNMAEKSEDHWQLDGMRDLRRRLARESHM
jgi:multimeric flavodoxin WrbA